MTRSNPCFLSSLLLITLLAVACNHLENGIEVVAVHNHMVHEQPRIFFLHYWGTGTAEKLAKGLKAALNQTGGVTNSRTNVSGYTGFTLFPRYLLPWLPDSSYKSYDRPPDMITLATLHRMIPKARMRMSLSVNN
ncbi:DUF1259 domain-containing protein [Chitinophaga sp. 212800010-3]|uniref:DUF1259 domain-containing protein n=1 Tax=unclassified Chitinophaga TaxID=2619133 RepID=UPI002DEA67D1|nr:hypothetical protein [Chitinophaga sp. 212800010-3]